MNLDKPTLEALISILDDAAQTLSCNGCNDYYLNDTPQNRAFVEKVNKVCCGDDEDFDVASLVHKGKIIYNDYMIAGYLRRLMENELASM